MDNMVMKNKRLLRHGLAVTFAVFLTVYAANVTVLAADTVSLIPGGMTFGVKLFSEGVLIVETGEVRCGEQIMYPAKDAGIKANDVILSINGPAVEDTESVARLIGESEGKHTVISVKRGGEKLDFEVVPVMSSDGSYKAGLVVRDGAEGIGTVTYIDSETGSFAGLGHGICDSQSGELIPMVRGAVVGAEINGVVKGEQGTPGELLGYFSSGKLGTVTRNTECGVYGVFCEIPEGVYSEAIPILLSDELHEGEAHILCTTGDDGIGCFSVNISDIDRSGRKTKNFTVTVTDPELISRTGGIVQKIKVHTATLLQLCENREVNSGRAASAILVNLARVKGPFVAFEEDRRQLKGGIGEIVV